MLTIALLIINFIIAGFGIYWFDYLPDQMINHPLIIISSLVLGTIGMVIALLMYIEVFYILIAKRNPKTSMLKHKIAKQMVSIPLHLTHVKITVEGMEHLPKDPGFTIFSNHTSLMDIPVLMYKLYEYPVAFLQKKVVANLFSVGKWTPELGCVNIDRTNPRKGAEAIIQTIKHVKQGSTMVIFPEGTRGSEIGELLPFKDGAFKVALKSKAPLVPITIVKPKRYKKIIWPLKKPIKLIIHPPLQYNTYKNLKSQELSERVKEIIKKSLETR
ncbi:MAG: lysophospholipid acyltransferase family protein [Candidatus Izemoplasma sp.]|nr:lysophospholipid acyltransferase family protein [Candidatus Izemoplasma sp.]